MPAILTKKSSQPRNRSLAATAEKVTVQQQETFQSPQAGKGACRLCSCKNFVPDSRFHLLQGNGQSMQPVPCGNCGHDIRQHA
jgi:hypothetical protein